MYIYTLLLFVWLTFISKIQACKLACDDGLKLCVKDIGPPDGIGVDCSGIVGCYKECPPKSFEFISQPPGKLANFSTGIKLW